MRGLSEDRCENFHSKTGAYGFYLASTQPKQNQELQAMAAVQAIKQGGNNE